jgi:hypothetical protein
VQKAAIKVNKPNLYVELSRPLGKQLTRLIASAETTQGTNDLIARGLAIIKNIPDKYSSSYLYFGYLD